MRSFATLFPVRASIGLAAVAWTALASAQVSDGQRAAARDLFKQGDELQRAGHFAEALDKFQRAEQVFAAPTNELRIAECEAALGQLVESGEAYRLVVRAVLAPGSPPAFQAAVEQAKAEFEQVDPRIPRLVVQVLPTAANVRLQIDGQSVPSALLGQPMPLDPGPHKASAAAPGYAGAEQSLLLKERETRVIQLVLKQAAAPSVTPSPAPVATTVPPRVVGRPLKAPRFFHRRPWRLKLPSRKPRRPRHAETLVSAFFWEATSAWISLEALCHQSGPRHRQRR